MGESGIISLHYHRLGELERRRYYVSEVESGPAPRSEELDPESTRVPLVWADHEG